jgi:hypothetical protein
MSDVRDGVSALGWLVHGVWVCVYEEVVCVLWRCDRPLFMPLYKYFRQYGGVYKLSFAPVPQVPP